LAAISEHYVKTVELLARNDDVLVVEALEQVENECWELLDILVHDERTSTAKGLEEETFLERFHFHKGLVELYLGRSCKLKHNLEGAVFYFEEARSNLVYAHKYTSELSVIEEYMSIMPEYVETLGVSSRIEHLKRLSRWVARAQSIAKLEDDRSIIEHNLKIIDIVLEDVSKKLVINPSPALAHSLAMYNHAKRTIGTLPPRMPKQATLIDLRDEEELKKNDVTTFLPAARTLGEVGLIAGDGIPRSLLSLDSVTPRCLSESLSLGRIAETNDPKEDAIFDEFAKKVSKAKARFGSQWTGSNEEWSSVPESKVGHGYLYWRSNGLKQEYSVKPYSDCRSNGSYLARTKSQDLTSPIKLTPSTYTKLSIATEQSEGLKAHYVQKRVETSYFKTLFKWERSYADVKQRLTADDGELSLLDNVVVMDDIDVVASKFCESKIGGRPRLNSTSSFCVDFNDISSTTSTPPRTMRRRSSTLSSTTSEGPKQVEEEGACAVQ
jgi:hypothetical protein